ncbi:recombinase family protein [Pseudacidovorax intermedius]|uniref:recombinase family protein n=1 Tax=Pseudacidovorax intermedius TaxID=433924 RepID=UPI003CC8185E
MKTAVIYARVSTQRQADEGVSLDAQVEQCRGRAEQLGAEVLKVFRDEGVSGRSTKGRHGFQAAVDFCGQAGVHFFITWATSRVARNAVDLIMAQETLRDGGTRLECLNADVNDDTDAGFINRTFMAAMDELHSRNISRDTLRSQKRVAAEGFFTGGRVPYGYTVVDEGKRRRMVPDADAAATVRRAFDLCLQEGLGAQAIAHALNDAGLFRAGARWGKNSVQYLLNNRVYTGVKTYNRKHSRTGRAKPLDEWVSVDAHEPLISKEAFERAQTMIKDRTPHEGGGTPRSEFVFAGKLTCGICSSLLQITNGTSRSGALYSYYSCVAHKHGRPQCLFRPIRADLMDEWLTQTILERVLTPEVVSKALDDVAAMTETWLRDREAARGRLVRDLRAVEGKRDGLLDFVAEHGRATPADVIGKLNEARAQIDELQAELDRLERAKVPRRNRHIDPEVAIEVMHETIMAADAKKKRAFMGAFLDQITVSNSEVEVAYRADALLQTGPVKDVHSGLDWLPDLGSNQGPTD